MQLIAAPDPHADRATTPRLDFTNLRSMKGLRLGLMRNYFGDDVRTDAETTQAIEAACDVFRQLGAEVRDVTIPPLSHFSEAGVLISRCEGYALHEANLRKAPHLYSETSRTRLMLGALIRAADYINAQRHRTVLLEKMAKVHEQVDLLIGPTVPTPAPPLELEKPEDARTRLMFTRVFNMTGAPVVSVCTGFSSSNLPLAMQIAGRPFEDDVVLAAGAAFEAATGHHLRRPTAFTGVAP
jgi:aspartyl-tRNA(Asn)/glutamyl-tRNA(Gln) amidotransferase subunit A